MWFEAAKKLAKFVELEDDWDGQKAIAPSPSIIIVALGLLIELREASRLPAPSRVGACPMGGILFEWQWPESDVYIEAEVTPAGEVEWMKKVPPNPVVHGSGTEYDKIEWARKETR